MRVDCTLGCRSLTNDPNACLTATQLGESTQSHMTGRNLGSDGGFAEVLSAAALVTFQEAKPRGRIVARS